MDDASVAERLEQLDGMVEQLEGIPGRTAELALDTVAALAEVYGEALRRVVFAAGGCDGLVDRLDGDQLLHHLLVLHGVHPSPVHDRVEHALAAVRPYVESHGGTVELVDVTGEVARVRLAGACGSCSGSAATLESTVTEAVLASAPELARVEAVTEAPSQPLISVESLTSRLGERV